VILYDQIGSGASTHLPSTLNDATFWQPSLFTHELLALISHLGITGPYNILGHSFGGYVAVDFASRQPLGLRRLILAGANASAPLFKESIWGLKRSFPGVHQKAIEEACEKGAFGGSEYKEAMEYFLKTYLCRADPWPREMDATGRNQAEDDNPRITM